MGNLLELTEMYLYRNKLTILPLTIGRLTKLQVLDVSDNHTTSPPVETVSLGTKAIISFFQHLLQARVKRRLDMPNLGLEAFPMEIEYMTYLTALVCICSHSRMLSELVGSRMHACTWSVSDQPCCLLCRCC